jgi:hypothetical protein
MAGSNHKVEIVVGVKDLASSALRGIQNTMNHMGRGFTNAGTFMGAFSRNLDSVIGKMDSLANSMYKFNMYTSNLQRNLKNIAMVGGAVVGGLAVQGTNKALDYDYKTRTMQSRMGVSNTVRKDVSDYILNDLSLKTSYKPSDIADIGTILGQGGVNNSKDMKAMLKTVSYFSEAVDAVPEQAAEMVISAAKGFGISMEKSSTITDKLAVALNQSLLSTEEMPHAIGELAGRANQYGQSFDSSLTALMTMRNQGMSAAQGSQDFLHALQSVSKIGNDEVLFKRTRGYFASMGVTDGIFNKDTRQLKEYPDLIADMEKAMINQGFINPKYKKGITDEKTFHDFLSKNGGAAPKDFWDSQKAMPLIAKVFGTAGMAPILMGLQSQYEEVNKKTGEKTGKVYYGADALKQMYKDVKNSDGAIQDTHDIIAQSGKFQLGVLGSAWDAAQIKLLDGIVPVIKTGAEQLTKFFNPGLSDPNKKPGQRIDASQYEYQSPVDLFRQAVKDAADNYRKEGHTGVATVVDTVGNKVIDGVQISQTLPKMGKQIGSAFNKDIVKADWGSNLIEFPWHIVKNGIKFISDIVKANKDFDDAVKELPENLQDPAKLVETLTKGGIVLLVTGAVIKVIELGVRGVSAALKGTKIATDLTKSIIEMFTGKKGKGGGVLSSLMGKNMAIKANIVNVYGGVVNGKGGPGGATVPGGGTAAGGSTTVIPAASSALSKLKTAGKWIIRDGIPMFVLADIISGATGGPSITKKIAQSEHNPLNPNTDKKIDEIHRIVKNPSTFTGPKKPGETSIEKPTSYTKPTYQPGKMSPATDTQGLAKPGENAIWSGVKKLVEKMFGNNEQIKQNNQEILQATTTGASQLASAAQQGSANMANSIIGGFGVANERLQNIHLNNNNNVSVLVRPPQVNISGTLQTVLKVNSSTSGGTSFSSRDSKGTSAWDKSNALFGRRTGW